MDTRNDLFPQSYLKTLSELKSKIKTAQIKAALSVNSGLILLYWEIGKTISKNQVEQGWGTKVIERLSKDLATAFPEMQGFSFTNLKYMKMFFEAYQGDTICPQVVDKLPWGHNRVILDKVSSYEEKLWYAKQTIENGWSRNTLVLQIESNLYQRQAIAHKTTNFQQTLPQPQSELAEQLFKTPYDFGFVTANDSTHERNIEVQLVKHIRKFLLELGAGFAFVGEQYRIEVENKSYYIDLLFYHLKLHCYVVIFIFLLLTIF